MKRHLARPGKLSRAGGRLLLLLSVMLLSAAGMLVQQSTAQALCTPTPGVGTLSISNAPGTVAAGTPFSFTVSALDTCGNQVNPPNPLTFSSSDSLAVLPRKLHLPNRREWDPHLQ